MTVTVVAGNQPNSQLTQLVAKQAEVSAHATAAATAGFQQTTNAILLRQSQEELVRGCLGIGRLVAASVISTFNTKFTAAWLAKYAPNIATLQTVANALAQGDAQSQLNAAQIQAVDIAMAQGLVTAATILSTMS